MKIYKGIVASEGKCKGKVKKVTSIEEINKVEEGDIVVTNNNSPLFSLAFMKASAIISECGGTLCHLAIVSREMQKPCILSVENATEIFKDNMIVEVDAFNNQIIIIKK